MNYMQPPMFLLYSYHTHLYNITSNMKYTGIHCTSLVRGGSSIRVETLSFCHRGVSQPRDNLPHGKLLWQLCISLTTQVNSKTPSPSALQSVWQIQPNRRVARIRVILFSFFNLDHFYLDASSGRMGPQICSLHKEWSTWNHSYVGQKGPLEASRPIPCSKQGQRWCYIRLLRTWSCWVVKISKDGRFQSRSEPLFQCSAVLQSWSHKCQIREEGSLP